MFIIKSHVNYALFILIGIVETWQHQPKSVLPSVTEETDSLSQHLPVAPQEIFLLLSDF